jgi:hypothetical protein
MIYKALLKLDIKCGISDGIYYPATERIVEELRSHDFEIENFGVHDEKNRILLEEWILSNYYN